MTRAQRKQQQEHQLADVSTSIEAASPTEEEHTTGVEEDALEEDALEEDGTPDRETLPEGQTGGDEEEGLELAGLMEEGGPVNDVTRATPADIRKWQQQDPSLQTVREKAEPNEEACEERVYFFYRQEMLYRKWSPREADGGDVRTCVQLVLPRKCLPAVLKLAHDVPTAGHLGITKTKDRILQRYYWPGVFRDVAQYCRTCEVCQRSQLKHPAKAPMMPMPLIKTPFKRIAMDIVGPLARTKRGHRFILTIVDYATRYPEAIALSSTEAPNIARELVHLFARVGVPEEILTDQGTNFMSTLLQEVYRLLHVKRIRTTPYHPQTDGLVERFNGTIKSMLRKFVSRNQKDWDEYLPYLLFAYREVPQESTGFSPFELLYGRRVRGPLDVLKEAWTEETISDAPVATYVVEMRDRLEKMSELVEISLRESQSRQKDYYDRKTQRRSFMEGEQVLVLLPKKENRLKLEWTGPYRISKVVTDVDYEVETPGRRKEKKVYHVNLLKKWFPADATRLALTANVEQEQDGEHMLGEDFPSTGVEDTDQASQWMDVTVELTEPRRLELMSLAEEFPEVFSMKPGRTGVAQHSVHVDTPPIRQQPYRIPYSRREVVRKELDEMLKAGVIKPSKSPWASPIVLVEKKDGTIRFCVDYRKVNKVSKFDAYPMPRVEEIFESIGPAKVISTLDLAKGYWQIPMAPESMEKTAFATPFGLYEFEVMPFGLHNAPATFQRTMNYVLQDCQGFAKAYIDDVVVYSESWEEHLEHLSQVFDRMKKAGLTLKLKKCRFGAKKTGYLGHIIGEGHVEPDPAKIKAIKKYPVPTTKKEVRAWLGLTGYYRRFVPDYATVAAPLTGLLKKGLPDKVKWTPQTEDARSWSGAQPGGRRWIGAPGHLCQPKVASPRDKVLRNRERMSGHCVGPQMFPHLPLRDEFHRRNRSPPIGMAAQDEECQCTPDAMDTHAAALSVHDRTPEGKPKRQCRWTVPWTMEQRRGRQPSSLIIVLRREECGEVTRETAYSRMTEQ